MLGHHHPSSDAKRRGKSVSVSSVVKGARLINLAKRFGIDCYHVAEGMTSTACPSCLARDTDKVGKLKPLSTQQVRVRKVSKMNERKEWYTEKKRHRVQTHRRQRCSQCKVVVNRDIASCACIGSINAACTTGVTRHRHLIHPSSLL